MKFLANNIEKHEDFIGELKNLLNQGHHETAKKLLNAAEKEHDKYIDSIGELRR